MKIAYYTDQIYLHGGIEKVLSQKLNYLSKLEDNEVYLITSEQKNKPFCYNISKKIKHFDLGVNYNRNLSYYNFNNLLKLPKHIYSLSLLLKNIRPDVLVVCNYSFDFYFIPFAAKGMKIIKEFHSSRYNYKFEMNNSTLKNKFLYVLNNWVEEKYNHLVILNKDEKIYFKSKNTVVIPNAAIKSNTKINSERKNIIISAGRIAHVKQFDHLINAWNLIEKKFPEWEVHIYGQGDLNLLAELEDLIISLSMKNIHFKGVTDELNQKMQEASIYALTSSTECFPMVLLEALSSGLPVVSYDCPNGPRNILSSCEDALLVASNNINEFSKSLEFLINDKQKREYMSNNGLINVLRFSEDEVMLKWINLFNQK